MIRRLLCITACFVFVDCSPVFGAVEKIPTQGTLKWSELPQLPPAPGHKEQVGLAGTFAGIYNDSLIVAGGANFPNVRPWEGGKKVWWDDVFVLEKTAEGKYRWVTDKSFKLPQPSAYGISISSPDGICCIGGCDADKCHNNVFLLKWNPAAKKISTEEMPALPRPTAFMAGAGIDVGQSHIFVKVTVLDKDNKRPAEGEPATTTVTDAKIQWKDEFSLKKLINKEIKLKFEPRESKTYSLSFDENAEKSLQLMKQSGNAMFNGKLSSEFTGNAKSGQLIQGAIGLQIHDKGKQVEFKDIRLKQL
jgi:hypothetical protein